MSNPIFDENKHLTDDAFRSLQNGSLNSDELISAAEHLGTCTLCLRMLSQYFESEKFAEVPSGFAEEIGKKISTVKEKRVQFVFYSLRVAIAACIALIIGFSGFFNFLTDPHSGVNCIKAPNFSFVNTINSDIINFSQKILNMEVFYNDKEKE